MANALRRTSVSFIRQVSLRQCCVKFLFAAVAPEIEGEEAVRAIGPLQYFPVAERAHRIVILDR